MQTSQQTQNSTAALLPQLLHHMHNETDKGRAHIPMAALCKRLDLRMSTLQRHLTALERHEIVTTHCDPAGRWTTTLTPTGAAFYQSLHSAE